MENNKNYFLIILIALLHIIPFIYLHVDTLFKSLFALMIIFVLYIVKKVIQLKNLQLSNASNIKSGKFTMKNSLTLNDLRVIKFKNFFGSANSTNKKEENSPENNNPKAISNKLSDNSNIDLDLIDRQTESNNTESNDHQNHRKGSVVSLMNFSQEASLSTIVYKKNKKS